MGWEDNSLLWTGWVIAIRSSYFPYSILWEGIRSKASPRCVLLLSIVEGLYFERLVVSAKPVSILCYTFYSHPNLNVYYQVLKNSETGISCWYRELVYSTSSPVRNVCMELRNSPKGQKALSPSNVFTRFKFYPLSNSFYIFFYLSVSVCDYVWVNDVVWHRPPDARRGCQILWSLRKEFVSHLMWVLVSGIQTPALVTEQQELITADPSLQCHF